MVMQGVNAGLVARVYGEAVAQWAAELLEAHTDCVVLSQDTTKGWWLWVQSDDWRCRAEWCGFVKGLLAAQEVGVQS